MHFSKISPTRARCPSACPTSSLPMVIWQTRRALCARATSVLRAVESRRTELKIYYRHHCLLLSLNTHTTCTPSTSTGTTPSGLNDQFAPKNTALECPWAASPMRLQHGRQKAYQYPPQKETSHGQSPPRVHIGTKRHHTPTSRHSHRPSP